MSRLPLIAILSASLISCSETTRQQSPPTGTQEEWIPLPMSLQIHCQSGAVCNLQRDDETPVEAKGLREVVAAVEAMPRGEGVMIYEIHTDGTGVDGPVPEDSPLAVLCRDIGAELQRIGFEQVTSVQLIVDPSAEAECLEASALCEDPGVFPSVVIP